MHILKCNVNESTDTDLQVLIQGIKHTMLKPEQVVSADDAVSRAMSVTTVYVGEALLRQEGLLLPDVHNSFIQEINTHVSTDREQCFTARWVLSNLKNSLQHHLNYVCKIRKCGTLLYRSNGDVLVALTNALYKISRQKNVNSTDSNEEDGTCEVHNTESIQIALTDVNSAMHEQIQVLLRADAKYPYQMDINTLISQINPTLWKAICTITQSVSERRGKGTTQHVKTVRRFFCLCALMFCINDRCHMPLHNLLTDMVDGLGGSTLLIKLLNRLGVCSSADTLARAIQFRVAEREEKGPRYKYSPTAFTIVSIDNIDFLHSYARVFCGDQKRSWHGTTIQIVQPQPENLHDYTESQTNQEHVTCTSMHSPAPLRDTNVSIPLSAHRRRKRDVGRPYTSPGSKSPLPKICRRARSAMESQKLSGHSSTQLTDYTQEPSVLVSRPHMHNVSLADFKSSTLETKSIDRLSEALYTYL